MFSHESVWAAIDALAERHSLSASGLARRAGLDPTTFNKSKRYAADGRARWPSTESLAKVMEATGATFDEFTRLIAGVDSLPRHLGEYTQDPHPIPLLGMAEAGAGGYFDDAGFPAGQGWDIVEFPARTGKGYMRWKFRASPCCPFTVTAIRLSLHPMRRCAGATAWWCEPGTEK
ncbi:Peptidase family S24 [Brucella abortus]|nr:Peptidase family S24 [Brucella abortus]